MGYFHQEIKTGFSRFYIDLAFVKKSRSFDLGKEVLDSLISDVKQSNRTFELSVAVDNIKDLRLYKNLDLKKIKGK